MGSAAQTQVYESDVRLLPCDNCLEAHGKGKQALRHDQDPNRPTRKECGYYTECDDGYLFPESAHTEDYRLATADPIHDLKRWTTTLNQRITGEEVAFRSDDARFFKHSPRFTEEHFRECISWVVGEIKHMHTTVRVQLEYLGAPPYMWTFFRDPIHEAVQVDSLPTLESVEGMHRGALETLVENMAVEMDYLSEKVCHIRNEILTLKWERAKRGDWGEISELIDSGWVDLDRVQRVCQIE